MPTTTTTSTSTRRGNQYEIINTTPQYLPTPGASLTTGLGAYEPSKNNTYSIEANTSKIWQLWGQHTLNVGYAYDHTNFLDEPARSGPLFAIPGQNYHGHEPGLDLLQLQDVGGWPTDQRHLPDRAG